MTEPAASKGAKKPRKRQQRRRFHVPIPPTAIWVTLLGALITVWVAPAFTRQYEERKEARELKADLAEQMTVGVARTLGDRARVRDILATDHTLGPEARAQVRRPVATDWRIARQRIAAKLMVYFDEALVKEWQEFGDSMNEWVNTSNRGVASAELQDLLPWLTNSGIDAYADGLDSGNEDIVRIVESRIEDEFVVRAGELATRIVRVEPAGFSTTRGDLLRDLLP